MRVVGIMLLVLLCVCTLLKEPCYANSSDASRGKLSIILHRNSSIKESPDVSEGKIGREETVTLSTAGTSRPLKDGFQHNLVESRTRRNILRFSSESDVRRTRKPKSKSRNESAIELEQTWLEDSSPRDAGGYPADICKNPFDNGQNGASETLGGGEGGGEEGGGGGRGGGDDTLHDIVFECLRTKSCEGGKPCGEELCCCCEELANCSGHGDSHRTLEYIPHLTPGITVLVFSGNGLTSINTTDFFKNSSGLSHLDLSNNHIRYLRPGAFDSLKNLSVLWLNNNFHLDFAAYSAAVFNITSLQMLDLSFAYSGELPADVFHKYHLPRLSRLFLNGVDLRSWNATAFQALENLQLLQLAQNDIRFISTKHIDSLSNLIYLNLVDNDFYSFPRSCQYKQTIYPSLEWLNLNGNRIHTLSKRVCLPKLRVLDLSSNPITSLVTNMFGSGNFPNLRCLIMEDLKIRSIQSLAFNNSALQYVDLMYNSIDFSEENVSADSFHRLPNVVFLQLGHNYLSNSKFIKIFSGLTALQYIYMGSTNTDKLTTETFASFRELRSVTLHWNFLWTIPDGVFDGFRHLTRVDLSDCSITTIGEKTFSSDTRRRLRHLDLSGNHLHCNCDLLWFRDWLRSNDRVFDNSYKDYTCHEHHKTRIVDFRMNEQVCLMSHDASVFTVVVVTLLMIILTLVAVVFRYRWSIRLLLYEAFRGKGRNSQLPANYFRFDAFVSYAEEDVTWVRKHLIEELEPMQGVRLCVHQRDFTPGQNIVDNIYQSVQDSRKVLMVFSRHFARSQWCQFELALCLSHVVEHDDTMLVTCVDDVTSSTELTPTMMAVLNTTTYIQWAEEDDAKASFWGRMRIALSDTAPAIRARNQHGT